MGNALPKALIRDGPSAEFGDLGFSVEDETHTAIIALSSPSAASATHGARILLRLSGGEHELAAHFSEFEDVDYVARCKQILGSGAVPALCLALARHAASDKLVTAAGLFFRNICSAGGVREEARSGACIPAVPLLNAALEARLASFSSMTVDQQAAMISCVAGLREIAVGQNSVSVDAIEPIVYGNLSRAEARLAEAASSAQKNFARMKLPSSLAGLLNSLKSFVREPILCAKLMLALCAGLSKMNYDRVARAIILRDGLPLIRTAIIVHGGSTLYIRGGFQIISSSAGKALLAAIKLLHEIASRSDDLGRERCCEIAPTLLRVAHQKSVLRPLARRPLWWYSADDLVIKVCGALSACAKREGANASGPAPWAASCSGQLNEILVTSYNRRPRNNADESNSGEVHNVDESNSGEVHNVELIIRRTMYTLGLQPPSACVALRVLPLAELEARLSSCFECWDATPRRSCSHSDRSALRECCVCRYDESTSNLGADPKWVALADCGHIFHERCILKWARSRCNNTSSENSNLFCPLDHSEVSVQVRGRLVDVEHELHVLEIDEGMLGTDDNSEVSDDFSGDFDVGGRTYIRRRGEEFAVRRYEGRDGRDSSEGARDDSESVSSIASDGDLPEIPSLRDRLRTRRLLGHSATARPNLQSSDAIMGLRPTVTFDDCTQLRRTGHFAIGERSRCRH